LVKCPKCGNEVTTPFKTWPLPSRKPVREGEKPRFVVGIFECATCKARFRASVENERRNEGTTSIKGIVERIRGIRGELVLTLRNLRDKIRALEIERSGLMSEIENLRKVVETRANALENEVGTLKEELKSLRDLLGYSEEKEKLQ
jgi:uncharacterized protein YlxW (UPF0749 family)